MVSSVKGQLGRWAHTLTHTLSQPCCLVDIVLLAIQELLKRKFRDFFLGLMVSGEMLLQCGAPCCWKQTNGGKHVSAGGHLSERSWAVHRLRPGCLRCRKAEGGESPNLLPPSCLSAVPPVSPMVAPEERSECLPVLPTPQKEKWLLAVRKQRWQKQKNAIAWICLDQQMTFFLLILVLVYITTDPK